MVDFQQTYFPQSGEFSTQISGCFFNRKNLTPHPKKSQSRYTDLGLYFALLCHLCHLRRSDVCCFWSVFFQWEKVWLVGLSMKRYIYIHIFVYLGVYNAEWNAGLILVCSVRWDVRYFKRTGAWRQWFVHADMCSFFSCSLALICFLLSLFLFAWLVCLCTHHYASHSWMYLLYDYI